MLDSVNEQQSLHVLKAGKGFTCLGFEVAFRKAAAVAEWCGCPPPDETLIDTCGKATGLPPCDGRWCETRQGNQNSLPCRAIPAA